MKQLNHIPANRIKKRILFLGDVEAKKIADLLSLLSAKNYVVFWENGPIHGFKGFDVVIVFDYKRSLPEPPYKNTTTIHYQEGMYLSDLLLYID